LDIAQSIEFINARIESACHRAGRKNDVKMVAVTKTVDAERIKKALDCGISTIGENKVQEIVDKFSLVDSDVEWHMIGHLQTNKVKYIVDKVAMIQSLDSIRLAEEINKQFDKYGRIIDVLVEINIGGERNKYGVDPDSAIGFIEDVSRFPNIKVCGLMTVAPALADKEEVRPYFRRMKHIFEEVKTRQIKNAEMMFLSMGMTNDFETAVEEGSNMVRIGSGIFGERKY
jgi:pyridoxal phosphate enzyme (YggS family)